MSVNLTRRTLDKCQGNLETLQKTVLRWGCGQLGDPGAYLAPAIQSLPLLSPCSLPDLPPGTPALSQYPLRCPPLFLHPLSPQDQGDR